MLRRSVAASGRFGDHGPRRVRRHAHFRRPLGPVRRPAFRWGTRRTLGDTTSAPWCSESGRSIRVDGYADSSSGALGVVVREAALRSAVGTPIIVDGRLWGLIAAGSSLEQPLPPDTEARLASFTELVATAVANAESRAELLASRARIVAATDAARRRIERDLHDGIQQQLVSLTLELRMAGTAESAGAEELRAQLARMEQGLGRVLDELQEISRGIHPAILSQGGLEPALRALARRSVVPVELDLRAGRRLPDSVEVAAYYAVSEALANVAKHAHASVVHVELGTPEAMLRLAIHDDGIGGADPGRGSGLTGLGDRIEAVGGTLQVTSPAGRGTTLLIEIPAGSQDSPDTAPLCDGLVAWPGCWVVPDQDADRRSEPPTTGRRAGLLPASWNSGHGRRHRRQRGSQDVCCVCSSKLSPVAPEPRTRLNRAAGDRFARAGTRLYAGLSAWKWELWRAPGTPRSLPGLLQASIVTFARSSTASTSSTASFARSSRTVSTAGKRPTITSTPSYEKNI